MFLTFNFLKILCLCAWTVLSVICKVGLRIKVPAWQISYYLQAIWFDYKIEELFFAAGNHIALSQD